MKVSPRVQGNILETASGARFIVIEQSGRDIWRGKHKSLNEAITAGDAGIGVDRILLQRAEKYGVSNVLVVVEEQRCIFVVSLGTLLNDPQSITRANWQGRATRVLPYQFYMRKYLGPSLQTKRKRASA